MKTPSLSSIEQKVFKLANEQYEILLNTIRSPEYQALEHGDVEQFIHQEETSCRLDFKRRWEGEKGYGDWQIPQNQETSGQSKNTKRPDDEP